MVLNFPVGDSVQQLMRLSDFRSDKVLELLHNKFSGYVVVTISGITGIEEGLLFFLEGVVSGAAHTFDSSDSAVFGTHALELFFNALAAEKGIVETYALSRQQVELILALEEKISAEEPKRGLSSLFVKSYSPELAQKLLPVQEASEELHKFEVLKKFGLSDLAK